MDRKHRFRLKVIAIAFVLAGAAHAQSQRANMPPANGAVQQFAQFRSSCPPGTIPVPETDDCVPARRPRGDRQDFDRRGDDGRDFDRRGSGRQDFDRRGDDRRDFDRRGDDRRDFDRRGSGRQDFDRRGDDRRDFDRRESERQFRQRPRADRPRNAPAWCSRARNATQDFICADFDLSRLESVRMTAHRRALFDSPRERANIEREHRRWVSRRDACGPNRSCIERRYREQIQVLESLFGN